MATRKTKPAFSKLFDDDKAQFHLNQISWVGQFVALVAFDGHDTDPETIYTVVHQEVGKASALTKTLEAQVISAGEDLLDEEAPMQYVVIGVRSTDPVSVKAEDVRFVGKFSAKFKKDFTERIVKSPMLVLWASDDGKVFPAGDTEDDTDTPVVAKKPSRRRKAAEEPTEGVAATPKPRGPAKAVAKKGVSKPAVKSAGAKPPAPRKASAKAS